MQRKQAPFWLKVGLLMFIILAVFWFAGFLAERVSFPVAVVIFLIALAALAASEERA